MIQVARSDAILCHLLALWIEAKLGHVGLPGDRQVNETVGALDGASHLSCQVAQPVEVRAEDLEGNVRPRAREHVTDAVADRLAEMFNGLIERLRSSLRRERRFRVDAKDISIEWTGATTAEAPIGPEDLDLIADHLLDNALKYTPDGGTVQVHVGQANGAVVFRVSDSGMGFAPEQADRLFDRFHRSSRAEQSAEGGGLGLSIVKAVVEQYAGTVRAESQGSGQGSTFEVRIPRPRE